MKTPDPASSEEAQKAVHSRAARNCFFDRLGIRVIEDREDTDLALSRALACRPEAREEGRLREAHATLVDPVRRSIYILVRQRFVEMGLMPPLVQPGLVERAGYSVKKLWRRIRTRFLARLPSRSRR